MSSLEPHIGYHSDTGQTRQVDSFTPLIKKLKYILKGGTVKLISWGLAMIM